MELRAYIKKFTFSFFLFLTFVSQAISTETSPISEGLGAKQVSKDFISVAKKAIPSVVSIKVQSLKQQISVDGIETPFGFPESFDFFNDDFWQKFFNAPNTSVNGQNQPIIGQGSGFIFSADGYILTNNHVVKDASIIFVTLNDGKEFEGKVIGGDPNTDIAVVKIDNKDLPYLHLGNSDDLEVGQWVVAIGNPLGLQASLTVGVVSAKGRSNLDLARVEDFIQTDAAINRGNSGGPLLDLNGNVIGINTAIATSTGAYMGIGFSIPSNMVKRIVDQLISTGSVLRGYLGMTLQKMDKDLAEAFSLNGIDGGLVTEVIKDSPAEKAGVMQGDVVLKYDSHIIDNINNFGNMIALSKPGTTLILNVKRGNKNLSIPVVVGAYPDQANASKEALELGITVKELTTDIATSLGYQNERGVVVTKVDSDSIAALAGIKKGSLIVSVNQMKISSVEDYNKAVASTEKAKPVLMLIRQGQMIRYVSLRVQ